MEKGEDLRVPIELLPDCDAERHEDHHEQSPPKADQKEQNCSDQPKETEGHRVFVTREVVFEPPVDVRDGARAFVRFLLGSIFGSSRPSFSALSLLSIFTWSFSHLLLMRFLLRLLCTVQGNRHTVAV